MIRAMATEPPDSPPPVPRSESPSGAAHRAPGDLPSLTALTAFEATVRLGSFTAAARALDRTQGAVSRQVALLESQIGFELFHREPGGLRATRAAEMFGARVERVLDRLRAALADVRERGGVDGVLHLSLLPTFGTTWLIPRLPAFLRLHPDVSVELTTALQTFDFDDGDIDAAIHYGEGAWPGGRAELLMEEHVRALAAPEIARGLDGPASLVGSTLLQLVSRPHAWRQWLAAHGADQIDGRRGPRFEHHMMVAEAACAGLGVALLPDFVAEKPVAEGRLVDAFDVAPFATRRSYWLVYPDRSLELPALLAFRSWLRSEIAGGGR